MKFWLNGIYAISEEFTQEEYVKFIKKLAWYDKRNEKYDKLYWEKVNDKGVLTLITYTGVLEPLSKFIIIDIHNPTKHIPLEHKIDKFILDGIEMVDFQCHSIYKSLVHRRGLIVIPTGGGKSYCSIALILHIWKFGLGKKGLVVVPSTGLADQYQEDALEVGCTKKQFGRVHGKAKEYGADVLVCVINSINSGLKNFNDDLIDHIKQCDFIITDEAHRISSSMYKNLYDLTNGRLKFMMYYTAEPFESDDPMNNYKDATILGLANKELLRIENKYLIEIGFVARPIVYMYDLGGQTKNFKSGFNRVYDTFIKKNTRRNAKACEFIEYFDSLKLRTLVLVTKLDHARAIMEALPALTAIAVFGGSKGLEREVPHGSIEEIKVNYNKFRKGFEKREWDVVFGSPTLDEGFNVKSIEAVVMLGGMKSKRKLIQRIGRGARKKKYMNFVYIVDFIDKGHKYVLAHSHQRKETYERAGSFLIDTETEYKTLIDDQRYKLREILKNV